jgi:hypothetical protein
LPRQARDRHRKNSLKSTFVSGNWPNQPAPGLPVPQSTALKGVAVLGNERETSFAMMPFYTKTRTEYLPRQARDKR